MFSTLVFLLLIGLCAAYPVLDGTDCLLRNGAIGICKPVKKCPGAMKVLKGLFGNPSPHIRCGFEGNLEIVCCPSQNQDDESDNGYDAIRFEYVPEIERTTMRRRPTKSSTPRPYVKRKPTTTRTPVNIQSRVAARECESIKNRMPVSVGPHITQGEEASEGEYPHMAALGYMVNEQLQFNCGGSLISDTFIVTAAHCIIHKAEVRPHMVRMGTLKIDGVFDTSDTDYTVEDTIIHPLYTTRSKYNDIALVKLNRPVTFSSNIFPACVYLKNNNPRDLTASGWGLTNPKDTDSRSKILLKAGLIAMSNDQCNVEYALYRKEDLSDGITGQQICAFDPDRDNNSGQLSKDTCFGDSGGPIQTEENGHISIVGITSFSGTECGSGRPTVYTRVSQYVDWIEAEVWPRERDPDADIKFFF